MSSKPDSLGLVEIFRDILGNSISLGNNISLGSPYINSFIIKNQLPQLYRLASCNICMICQKAWRPRRANGFVPI